MTEKHKLEATKRKISGRKVKQLRKSGILPANLYGKEIKSLALQLATKDFLQVYEKAGETGIVELKVADEIHPVLIHNLQRHPVNSEPLHVDFHQIKLTEKVKAMIAVVMEGESPAVSQKIGALLTPVSEIEVEALPQDLPEKISVDITGLTAVGQEIKVKDLKISDKVTVLADQELMLAKTDELVSEETKKLLEEEKAQAEAAAATAAAEAPVTEEKAAAEAPKEEVPKEEAKLVESPATEEKK